MKELENISANFCCALSEDGKLLPQVEVIFILSEPSYQLDGARELTRSRVLTETRVSMSPQHLRRMARAMLKTAQHAEEQLTKALNDHAAHWAAMQPAEDASPAEQPPTSP